MTIVHLGVIVFVVCLSTQVVSQNVTTTAGRNSTSNLNTTTVATGTYSSSANTTSPTGAGVQLHAGTFSFLIPTHSTYPIIPRSPPSSSSHRDRKTNKDGLILRSLK
ncbi:hypothetical protein Q5P01_004874 [Channa striata]|uniref:Uncharacterized protein n=1 Tax=Channa striata TaxID=64152 RepID=A0AA88NBX9_CHASR|nr:hypothetical protein Q5P01_004874 [Channa striata]